MKRLEVNIELTENQENLLTIVSRYEEGCEAIDIDNFEENEDDLRRLCELGLLDSVLGEQFYVTDLGEQYLNRLGENE